MVRSGIGECVTEVPHTQRNRGQTMYYKLTIAAAVVSDESGVEIPLTPDALTIEIPDLVDVSTILAATYIEMERFYPYNRFCAFNKDIIRGNEVARLAVAAFDLAFKGGPSPVRNEDDEDEDEEYEDDEEEDDEHEDGEHEDEENEVAEH